MTTPVGQISASDVNIELVRASGAQLDLNEGSNTVVGPRFLAGIFTNGAAISMNDLRGKTLFVASGPSSVFGQAFRSGAGLITATTVAAVISAAGGDPSYSYSWSYVSGDSASVFNPSSASTQFSRTVYVDVAEEINLSGVYRCTITDSIGRVRTVDVTVNTRHTETS